ncbi:glucose-6-phosphate 1-dehydrogenase [Brachionus plicatilis]|uniref:Glucose-6-phosphate 1-dehydrogenase n=1 Tax=Brachionus plicatilis TaxID=10195 RepID=A0A3M7SHR3_BRAPC|nr:glucose-6-phosphate 1-dehydrogenase [Brachionus plicatilis]
MRKRDRNFEVYRKSIQEQNVYKQPTAFVIFGASGDLAKKEIYPNLFWLFKDSLLPQNTAIVGFGRKNLEIKDYLKQKIVDRMKLEKDDQEIYDIFVDKNHYICGNYNDEQKFKELDSTIQKLFLDSNQNLQSANRIFYLAVPPKVYPDISKRIAENCRAKESFYTHLVLEKPFGKDTNSSNNLSAHLSKFFQEEEIFRIDHYLGKEMVQSILAFRFANQIFRRAWNRDSIESVLINFKENFGTEGRAGYFDEYGIIRDVIQNHLLQILTIIAMDQPISNSADAIRDEKVKVLKSMDPIKIEDVVLGQYVANEMGASVQKNAYTDDKSVPDDSLTSTFATMILYINNERWDGVPFIISAGKALDRTTSEVRIQFKQVPGNIFKNVCKRNELIIRIQPDESICLKMQNKRPGMDFILEETDLDLTYAEKYEGLYLPKAYERLLMDVIYGSQISFVRSDELEEAWRIFTPILHQIEAERIKPICYKFGSQSIPESDNLITTKGNYTFRRECK